MCTQLRHRGTGKGSVHLHEVFECGDEEGNEVAKHDEKRHGNGVQREREDAGEGGGGENYWATARAKWEQEHLEPSMLTNSSATCDRREGAQLRPQSELTHWQPLERDAQRHSSAIPHDRRDAEGGLKREDGQSGKRLGRVLSIFGCRIFNNSQLVQNHLQTSEFVLDGGSEAAGVTYHQARRRRHVQRDPKNGMADCSGLGRLDRCCLFNRRV